MTKKIIKPSSSIGNVEKSQTNEIKKHVGPIILTTITSSQENSQEEKLYLQKRKNLADEMISIGEAKDHAEALSLILERERLISEWKENTFDSQKIPEFLYNYKLKGIYDTGYLIQEINQEAKKEAPSLIEKDKEIKKFIELLKQKGKPKIEFAQTPHKEFFLNLSRFEYNEELAKELEPLFEAIKKDKKRLALLVYAVKYNFPQIWFGFESDNVPLRVSQQMNGYFQKNREGNKNYKENSKYDLSSKEETSNLGDDKARFNRVMGEEIDYETSPNNDSTGNWTDHYFSRVHFSYDKNEDKKHLIHLKEGYSWANTQEEKEGDRLPSSRLNYSTPHMEGKIQFDNCLIAAVHGEEYLEKISKNLEESAKKIANSPDTFRKEIGVKKLFKENYENAVKTMPEAIKILKEYSADTLKNFDVDVEHKILAYLKERSEYGTSGGIGRFSQVVLWVDGKEYKKEYQYRDRYSGTNDKYQFEFNKVKIKNIKKSGDTLNVQVEAIPGQDKYGSTYVEFNGVESIGEKLAVLSEEDFEKFKSSTESEIQKIVKEKSSKHTGHKHLDREAGMVEMPWKEPEVIQKVFSKEGFAAFVINETIDYGSSVDIAMPQVRSELYVVKNGEKPKEIERNHKYVIQVHHQEYNRVKNSDSYGDPSIIGLSLKGNVLEYSSPEKRKEIIIK